MDQLIFNTFSIVARCKKTGMLGMAVSTARPCVGGLAVFVKSKTGAIASQAAANPYFGIHGLEYLDQGLCAEEVMEKVKSEDEEFEKRQLAIVDNDGNVAGYTGKETVPWAGHHFGDQYGVVGNMLVGEQVIEAMVDAYEATDENEFLGDRLMKVVRAGQDAGGDKRGKISAAIKILGDYKYPLVDIRVDEHEDPVTELGRIYEIVKRDLFPYIDNMPKYGDQ